MEGSTWAGVVEGEGEASRRGRTGAEPRAGRAHRRSQVSAAPRLPHPS